MKKLSLILASIFFLSINSIAADCTANSLSGTFRFDFHTKSEDEYDPCGDRDITIKEEYTFINNNGVLNGTGYFSSRMAFANASCAPKIQHADYNIISSKNGGLLFTAKDGSWEGDCSTNADGTVLTIRGRVYNKQGDSSTPTDPTNPTKPFVPEVCLNCTPTVDQHPLLYPPFGPSEPCNEKNIIGTWKETKEFTDPPANYCQWEHKTTEIITIEKGVHDGPLVVFKASGYIIGAHTLIKKDESWDCKTIIEDRQYTKVEMGKLDNGFVMSSLYISDLRPQTIDSNSPRIPGKTTHVSCRIVAGEFMIFDDPAKTRLEKQ